MGIGLRLRLLLPIALHSGESPSIAPRHPLGCCVPDVTVPAGAGPNPNTLTPIPSPVP